jgi:hypothetical protein
LLASTGGGADQSTATGNSSQTSCFAQAYLKSSENAIFTDSNRVSLVRFFLRHFCASPKI